MTKAVEALKTRRDELIARRAEYEIRHLEKCQPVDEEIKQLDRMIGVCEPEYETRQPDQIGE